MWCVTLHAAWTPRLLRLPKENTSPWGGSPDMAAVVANSRDVAGETGPLATFLTRERGFRAHLLAWDDDDAEAEALGCAHMGRLAVGGFLVLKSDHLISRVLVRPAARRRGVGCKLLVELLRRLPPTACAGAVADDGDAQACAFCTAGGGEARGGLADVARPEPLVALALVISTGGALARRADATRLYRFRGQSARLAEYRSDGRLIREQEQEQEQAQLRAGG